MNELLSESGPPRPEVLIVGPGAVTRAAAFLLNDSAAERGRLRKWVGDLARYADQGLRRIPVMPLRSLEPMELSATLSMAHELTVADRSRRVLAAVQRDLPRARCVRIDIEREPIGIESDVVIAFNVVCRLSDTAAGMRQVVGAVRQGGLLLIDGRSAAGHAELMSAFVDVGAKIHRKTGGRAGNAALGA